VDELHQLKAFFATPLGQKYHTVSLDILSDPAIAKWQTDVAARGQMRLKAELATFMSQMQDAIKADQQEHAHPS
jgi:hypothetical protein